MPEVKVSPEEFAIKIKAKYPQYKDVDNTELVERITKKYPEYKNSIDYTLKKKEVSEPVSKNGSKASAQPSSTFQNINTSNNLLPTVETTVPTPLTQKGGDDYLQEQIQPVQNVFEANLGSDSQQSPVAPSNPELINSQGIGGKQILESAPEVQKGNYGSYTWNQLLNGIGTMAAGTVDAGLNNLPEAINFTPSGVMAQIGEKVFGIENPYKKNEEQIADFRNNEAEGIRNYLTDNLGADIDSKTQQEYQQGIISGGVGGLVNSIPAIAATAVTGNISPFFIQGYDSALQSLDGKDVDDETKTLYATGLGYVGAKLEKIGFDKVFPGAANGLATSLFKKSLGDAIDNTGGKVTGNVLDKYIDENLKGLTKRFAKFGSKSLQGFVAEYATGGAQEVATIGSEYLLNEATGKPVFDTEDMSKWEGFVNNVSRANKAGLMEGVGGGIMGGGASIISPSRKKIVSETRNQLNVIDEQINNPEINEATKELLLQRKIKLEEQIENEVASDIKDRDKLTPKQKEEAELLSLKIDDLESQLQSEEIPVEVKETLQLEFNETVSALENIAEPTDTNVGQLEEIVPETTATLTVVPNMEIPTIQPNDIVNYTDEAGNVIEVPVEAINGENATIGINNEGIYETKEVPLAQLSTQQGVENIIPEETVPTAETATAPELINETPANIVNETIETTEPAATNVVAETDTTTGEDIETGNPEASVPTEVEANTNPNISEQLNKKFDSVEEFVLPEGAKRAGKSEYRANTKDGYSLTINPSKDGYSVFLGKPGRDMSNVDSFNQIESWFPANETELNSAIEESEKLIEQYRQITDKVKSKFDTTNEPSVEILENQTQLSDNFIATTDEIETPDGEKGFKVTITDIDGNPVTDNNGDNEYEFTDQDQVDKFITAKQKGYELAKQAPKKPKTDNKSTLGDLVGKVVSFDRFGSVINGTVTKVENGLLDVKRSNGITYTIKESELIENDGKEFVGEQASTQDRKSSLTTDRIRPLKIKPSASPKKLNIILKDVSEALKATLVYGKSGRSRSLGTYNPSNTLVKIRNAGDLDTTAHELGHLIDDRYDLLGNIPPDSNIQKEIKWYFERGGSNPPSGLSANAKKAYLNREGFAEFIRAYIVNKPQTKFQSPDLYDYFEKTVDEKTKKAIEDFSNDFLNYANASYGEQIISNIESSDLPNKNEFLEWFKTKKGEYGWNVTFLDKVNGKLLNSLGIAEKAFKFGLEQTKITSVANSKNFEILARVFAGVNGKTLNMLNNGLRDHNNILLEDEKGSPLNIEWLLEGLDNTSESNLKEEMDDVIKLLVAERTVEYAKKFNRTDKLTGIGAGVDNDIEVAIGYLSEFDKIKTENIDKYNRIRESADKYRTFADAGLKYARDKGRISEEQYEQIKEDNKYYVSLARRNETAPDEDPLGFTGNSSSLTGVKDIIKRAKGGTGTIKNPYLSLIENTVNIITEADRNEVIQAFVQPFSEKRQMGDGEPIDLAQVARQVNESGKNSKVVYVDGKKQIWQFEEEVYKSLSNFDKEPPDGMLSKFLQVPGKVLRTTVTKFPVFFARNITRDTQQRMIVSRTGSGLKDLLYNKTDKELFEIFGGSQGGYHLLNRNAYSNALGASIKEISKSKKSILLDPKRIMNGYDSFLESGENLNRIAEFKAAYRKAKAEGLDDYEAGLYAAYQARDLMDFAVAGTYLRALNKYVPFTNAAVQGLRRAYKSAKEDPKRFSINIVTNIIIPQLIVKAIVHAMGDDDEYEELPAYQRDMFWNFKTPFTGDYWISIPKPFEIGMFGSVTDRAISKLMGYEDAFEDFDKSLISTLSPVDETTLLGPLRPYIENLANRDFFRDQTIVPVWEQDKLLALRDGTKYASNISKKLSEGMGLIGIDADPRYIDHFIKSTTSYYGDLALRLGDLGNEESRYKFNISNSGFAKEAPVYNSESVKKAFDLSKKLGRERSSEVKTIRNMIEGYYSLESEPEKDKLLKEIYAKAKSLKIEYQKQVDEIENKED